MPSNRPFAALVLALVTAAGVVAAIAAGSGTGGLSHTTYRVTLTPNWVSPDDDAASNYQNAWVYATSPTTPFRPRGYTGPKRRYLLLDPRVSDTEGNVGNDEWWFVIERYWPADYPANDHGKWGREVNFHNVAGDSGPANQAGIGWGFGSLVSALAFDWRDGSASPSFGIEPSGLNLAVPTPSRDSWHTYLVRWVAGRTDGSTPRPGAITVWVDGADTPVIQKANIDTVQRATGPDGVTYLQRWVEVWDGDYTSDLPVIAKTRMVLTRIGRTLPEALADVPVRESDNIARQYYRGTGVNLGPPSITADGTRAASDASIPPSLGGAGSTASPTTAAPVPAATTTTTTTTTTTASPTTTTTVKTTTPTTTTTTTPTTTTTTTVKTTTTTPTTTTTTATTTTPTTTTTTAPTTTTTTTPTTRRGRVRSRNEQLTVKAVDEGLTGDWIAWDGRLFSEADVLRRHLTERGVDWTRYLQAHPQAVTRFALRPVRWAGRTVYDRETLAVVLRRSGTDVTSWSATHPRAAAMLEQNARATITSSGSIPEASVTAATARPIVWDGVVFTRLASLREHVTERGVSWQRFLAQRPELARRLNAPSVRWAGQTFFTRAALVDALERAGSSFPEWAKQHAPAARALP